MSEITRQDIENLRNDLRDHATNDRADFKDIYAKLEATNREMSEWSGGMKLIKFLGLPGIALAAFGSIMNLIHNWK